MTTAWHVVVSIDCSHTRSWSPPASARIRCSASGGGGGAQRPGGGGGGGDMRSGGGTGLSAGAGHGGAAVARGGGSPNSARAALQRSCAAASSAIWPSSWASPCAPIWPTSAARVERASSTRARIRALPADSDELHARLISPMSAAMASVGAPSSRIVRSVAKVSSSRPLTASRSVASCGSLSSRTTSGRPSRLALRSMLGRGWRGVGLTSLRGKRAQSLLSPACCPVCGRGGGSSLILEYV